MEDDIIVQIMPVTEHFSIYNQRSIELGFDRRIVLPPDEATVRMAHIGKKLLEMARLAEQIYKYDHNDALDTAIDLGSGSAVIGMAIIDQVKTLTSVDNDPRALDYGKQNLEALSEAGLVDLQFIEGSWNDATLWEALPQSGLIISNPPYLVKGEPIRPGYEQTPQSHLYVDTMEELVATYKTILSGALKKMPMWGNIVMRLPRDNEQISSWPQLLVKDSLEDFQAYDDSYFMIRSVHDDQGDDRPLHFLYIQRLPIDYDFLETTSDPNILNVQYGRHDRPLITVPSKIRQQRVLMVNDLW
jgi:methylase of polypeptide subunit release factors